jgi:hypothetical protein
MEMTLSRRVQDAINHHMHTTSVDPATHPISFGYNVAKVAIEAYKSEVFRDEEHFAYLRDRDEWRHEAAEQQRLK